MNYNVLLLIYIYPERSRPEQSRPDWARPKRILEI